MTEIARYDICVIGGGSGGLAVAIGAALLGVRVAVIEARPPGADGAEELATAALLAVTAQIQAARRTPGIEIAPTVDLADVRSHVEATVAAAAPTTAPERLRALGIDLIEGRARFLAPDRVATDAGPRLLTARRFVLAPIGTAHAPPIPGLDQVPALTPADLAALDRLPEHLAVLGNGADALELAQAYRRLGCAVTLIAETDLLDAHDPELVDLLLIRLRSEGVRILTGTPIRHIVQNSGGIAIAIGPSTTVTASHVLIAAGRRSDFAGLDLALAGVQSGPGGLLIDRQLRTSNRRVYALVGQSDAPGRVQDTVAQGGVVLRRILFRQNLSFDPRTLPRVVRTDPGLVQIGRTERQARLIGGSLNILRAPLHDNDRARAEGMAHGLVKALTDRKGRILGASVLAPNADELLQVWQLAIAQKMKIGAIAALPIPYPTLSEASKRAAGAFFAPRLLSARTRKLVRWLAMLG